MTPKQKNKPLRYFYYRDNLYKKIQINRGADIIVAWNYPKAQLEKLVYSDVRSHGERAFSTRQVLEMLNRKGNDVLFNAIRSGDFNPPQHTYGLDEKRNTYAYYWREKDIMDFHAYLTTVHIGRPRKDGRINTGKLPSAAELRAMIKQGTVFYVKVGDNFVPTWQAEKF